MKATGQWSNAGRSPTLVPLAAGCRPARLRAFYGSLTFADRGWRARRRGGVSTHSRLRPCRATQRLRPRTLSLHETAGQIPACP